MKRNLLTLLLLFQTFWCLAQVKPDGTQLTDIPSFEDIDGNVQEPENVMGQGKHLVFFFFSAINSPQSWAINSSGMLDDYYKTYGPSGTVGYEAMVYMLDGHPNSSVADIRGTTAASNGDWTAGNTFPIADMTMNEVFAMADSYFDTLNGAHLLAMPAMLVICPNSQIFTISTQINTVAKLRSRISTVCGLAPLGVHDMVEQDFVYNIFPNPTAGALHLKFSLDNRNDVSYHVYNMAGQLVSATATTTLESGVHSFDLQTGNWSNGLYQVNLTVGGYTVTKMVSVQH